MRPTILLFLSIFGIVLAGCNSAPSSNPKDYIGEYVFRPGIAVPDEFADFLVLNENQQAIEIRFDKKTGDIQTKTVKWSLSRSTGQNVDIDNFSSPVEGPPSKIRLGLNDDLGQYYEKVR